jgi:hypothetical protein
MSVSLEGLQSGVAGEERAVAILKVTRNEQVYDWTIYIPPDVDLSEYLASKESEIYADIDSKEAQWEALDPKNIEKSEIVKPDFPDYYAKRKAEYPSIGDQLDALWKGGSAATNMTAKITEIKLKYPKP